MLTETVERKQNPTHLSYLSLSVAAIALGFGVPSAFASPRIRPYFFATSEACAASGSFSEPECTNAFYNAEAEVRAHAPNFATKFDCELRFRLCGSDPLAPSAHAGRGQAWEQTFSPVMLGVEISVRDDERVATPVVAVEPPPGTFRACPISRRESSDMRVATLGNAQILRADRFEPKTDLAPSAEGTKQTQDPGTRARRREWLKSLPSVE